MTYTHPVRSRVKRTHAVAAVAAPAALQKRSLFSISNLKLLEVPVPLQTQEGILIDLSLRLIAIVNEVKIIMKKFFKICKAYGFKELL